MGMREYNPYGTESVEVKFICNNCGHEVVSDNIIVPIPDFSAENHSDSIQDNYGNAVCSNCGKEYEVFVYAGMSGGDIEVDDVEDEKIIDVIEYYEEEHKSIDKNIHDEKNTNIYTGFKINSFKVADWYILKDFEINFQHNINVIIGENGSGKSTVIECITLIFGHLYKYFIENDTTASFIEGYTICFESQDIETGEWYNISIKSNYITEREKSFNPILIINQVESSIKDNKDLIKKILPTKIGIYYAGITDRLENLSLYFEEKYRRQVTQAKKPATLYPLNLPSPRPILYTKKEHIGIMFLCLLISDNLEIKRCIEEELNIDIATTEIEFNFQKPSWAKSSVDDFWGASDLARQFIMLLTEYSDKQTISEERIKISHNCLYIKDELKRIFADSVELHIFDILDFLLFNDLLESIDIKWESKTKENIELDHLSEGEKQLITAIAFRLLWEKQKGFLLFDEPDTFLHPKWQREYIQMIEHQENIFSIITTHSPTLVGTIEKEQVNIMDKGKIVQHDSHTFGRDINSILLDLFKVKERSEEGEKLLNSFYEAMDEKDYKMAKEYLNNIQTKFGKNDNTTIKTNFLFDDFAE